MPLADGLAAVWIRCEDANNLSLSSEVGVPQRGIYRVEPCVAIGGIHFGMEMRFERQRVSKMREPEVGCIGVAIYHQVAQSALVIAGRG